MIKTSIVGPGNGVHAIVTDLGQLVTASLLYDETKFKELAEPDTAYSFYKPLAKQQFVITSIFARADKQVSSTVDATVVVYEGETDATITVDKVLLQFAMVQGDTVPLPQINIIVNEGKYVNAKTSDDDIHMNILGYYIPAL